MAYLNSRKSIQACTVLMRSPLNILIAWSLIIGKGRIGNAAPVCVAKCSMSLMSCSQSGNEARSIDIKGVASAVDRVTLLDVTGSRSVAVSRGESNCELNGN